MFGWDGPSLLSFFEKKTKMAGYTLIDDEPRALFTLEVFGMKVKMDKGIWQIPSAVEYSRARLGRRNSDGLETKKKPKLFEENFDSNCRLLGSNIDG